LSSTQDQFKALQGQSEDNPVPVKATQLIAEGTAPTVAAGAGAGSSPTVTLATGSKDLVGKISVVAGTTPTASGIIATVTLNLPCPNGCFVQLTPANAAAEAILTAAFVSSETATAFQISAGTTALVSTTTYLWNYQVTAW
jgi:hypothetical protein